MNYVLPRRCYWRSAIINRLLKIAPMCIKYTQDDITSDKKAIDNPDRIVNQVVRSIVTTA